MSQREAEPVSASSSQPGYLRWPALHGDALFVVADGSVWRRAGRGDPLLRLTDRALRAREPAVSACGRWLAFAGLSGTAHELWMLDLQHGGARALSAEALPLRICGWHPGGRVLVAWRGLERPMLWTLRLVDPASGEIEDLPLHDAGDGCFVSPTRLVFVRGGLQDDHASRYRGGAMRRLWSVDLDHESEAVPLQLPASALAGECWAPRFDGERLHFLSDAGATPCLWISQPDGRLAEPLPPADYDQVEAYATRGGTVVVASNGFLYEPACEVPLQLPLLGDWAGLRPGWDCRPMRLLEAVAPHATAGALLRCRGRLWWLAPPGGSAGDPVALPWPGGRAGAMAWAADGRAVFAVSDASGEQEIWRLAPGAEPLRLTGDGGAERTGLWPSPCGRWLLHADARYRLWLHELASSETAAAEAGPLRHTAVDLPGEETSGPVADAAWAVDGKSVVLARPIGPGERIRLELWRLGDGRLVHEAVVGDPAYACFSPAWSACGGWLFYLCARHFEAPDPHPWGDRNIGIAFPRRVCVDAQAMVEGAAWPWAAAAGQGVGFVTPPGPARAGERRAVPIPPDAHARLFASARGLVTWVRQPRGNAAAMGGLWRLDHGPAASARSLARPLRLYAQAGEAALGRPDEGGAEAPLLWLQPGSAAEDAASPALAPGWRVPVDSPAEWAQHLRDAWRHRRERVFEPSRHDASGALPLQRALAALPRVRERSEVDVLLAHLLRDLGTLHSFVFPPPPDTAGAAAFIGVRTEPAGDGLRVAEVLRGSDTDPAAQGPAAAAGVRVDDCLVAIAGQTLDTHRDGRLAAARWLAGSAGRSLPITLLRPDGTRVDAIVRPHDIAAETALRHADRVRRTRERVASASAAALGYLHLAAMRQADLERFVRDAWANPSWRGLVLDLRGNRGGNIDSWLVAMLARKPWAWWSRRQGPSAPNPPGSLPEPLAVLIDAQTYSDGETLAAGLQRLGRGRLFGTRTSGAGVWLRQEPNLLDGGTVAVGEFGQFDHGGWLIEGHGVEPDETADLGPRAAAQGHDAVLERAMQWLLARISEAPPAPLKPISPS